MNRFQVHKNFYHLALILITLPSCSKNTIHTTARAPSSGNISTSSTATSIGTATSVIISTPSNIPVRNFRTPSNVLTNLAISSNTNTISAGNCGTCSVSGDASGSISKCWGTVSGVSTSATPVQASNWPKSSQITVIAVSQYHNNHCYKSSGELFCGGVSDTIATNPGITTKYPGAGNHTPISIGGFESGVSHVAVGAGNVCVVKNGAAFCTGNNLNGKSGNGLNGSNTSITNGWINVPSLESNVTGISTSYSHSCAIVSEKVFCWGDNSHHQSGQSTGNTLLNPTEIYGLSSVSSVVTLESGSCAISQGKLYCWGDNSQVGVLGFHSTTSYAPTSTSNLPNDIVKIAGGHHHACALSASGALYCWGRNTKKQVIASSPNCFINSSNYLVCSTTKVFESGVSDITAGGDTTCANVNGDIKCWGNSTCGQAGVTGGYVSVPQNVILQ